MRVGIIGIGKIGKFHTREFHNAGCEIAAVLTTSEAKKEEKEKVLREEFGIHTWPFSNLNDFLNQHLDIVSICSPPETHYELTKTCLEKGINVLCEKPFVKTEKEALELFTLADKKKLILSVNMQWPSIIERLKNKIDFEKIDFFEGSMEPGEKGLGMLEDHLPHLNSLVIKIFGFGKITDITFEKETQEEIDITFKYLCKSGEKKIRYFLKYKAERPRDVSFTFGKNKLIRKIGAGYVQKFYWVDGDKEEEIQIEDPLKVSIKKFVAACREEGTPLISGEEIVHNVGMSKTIIGNTNI